MLRYYSYSLALHAALFLLLGVGIFQPEKHILPQEQVLTVELLTISDITNVKPPAKKPAPPHKKPQLSKEAPKKSLAEPTKRPTPKPAPPVKPITKKPTPKPSIKKPEIKSDTLKPIPTPEPTPEPEPQQPEKKDPIDPFASVLKSVEALEESIEKPSPEEALEPIRSNAKEENYQTGIPLSLSEKDAIRQQIMRHWSVVSGAKDAENMRIVITITLSPDGHVTSHTLNNQARYHSDSFYRAMADSAVRAIYKASPLQQLPVEKYHSNDGWKTIEVHFDPKEMLF